MSPLLDVQRRNQEIGRIRAGISEPTGRTGRGGKEIRRPKKLDTFVFSSQNRVAVAAAAVVFGGEVEAWDRQWRVITTTSEIPCSVPGGAAALNQAWELWKGGVCVRRCDGVTEQLRQAPCLCPDDTKVRGDLAKGGGDACRPKSRINLIVPDLPGLGVWRLETGSWNAALEIGGVIELLARARERGTVVPAVLRLDRRESKTLVDIGVRPDPRAGVKGERVEAHEFCVPVLDVLPTMRELQALGSQDGALALPPPPSQMRAIAAGQAATPVYGVPVEAPAAWSAEAGPAPQVCAQPPQDAPAGRAPQTVAVEASAATGLVVWRALWEEARTAGWLDDMVSLDPSRDDAPYDALRTVLEEHGARIKEGR